MKMDTVENYVSLKEKKGNSYRKDILRDNIQHRYLYNF